MTIGNWLQLASLLLQAVALPFVAYALYLSYSQLRHVARQSEVLANNYKQMTYESLQSSHASYLGSWVADRPELLRRHLEIRGYPVGSDEQNRQTLFMLLKLETHEHNAISNKRGWLDSAVWSAWRSVMRSDVQAPEFQSLWPVAKQYYATDLSDALDEIIAEAAVPRSGP